MLGREIVAMDIIVLVDQTLIEDDTSLPMCAVATTESDE